MWALYMRQLSLYPIRTKSTTSFFSAALGDIIAQRFSREKGTPVRYDWARTLRLALFNGVIMGPIGHVYYGILDSSVFPNSPKHPLSIVSKLCVDQLLWSPLCTVLFYAYKCVMEARAGEVARELSSKLVPTVVASWKLWIPAHVVNFSLVPTEQRVLYANVVSIAGTYVLSTCAASPSGPRRQVEPDMALPEPDIAALSSNYVTAAQRTAAGAKQHQAKAAAAGDASPAAGTTAALTGASALSALGPGATASTSLQLRPDSPRSAASLQRRSASPVRSGRGPTPQTLPRAPPPSSLRRGHTAAAHGDARDTITAVRKPNAPQGPIREQGVLGRSLESAAAKADRLLAGAQAAVHDVVRTPTKLK